ncbi:MAG: Gfo/Idh/MocA family oxidoreductase [Firmicutes bacterium]|nr:Gfo/Idh/MocA family oxidoreductase [Bacillota bacterium]
MEKTIRWAVCGLGKITKRFCRVLQRLPGVKLVACVSSSKERALAFQKKYGLEAAYTYEEFAANPGAADAVYVANNMNMHRPTVNRFLNAGIPVLCEKSFCLNKAEAEEMTACARKNNVLLMEAMWTRFLPSAEYVRGLFEKGELGKIKAIRAYFKAGIGHPPGSRVFRKAVGGGSVLDLAVYPAGYTHMLLGVPESISASGTLNKDGVDLRCSTEFRYPNNVTAKFDTSLLFMQIREDYNIYCEKAHVKIYRFYQSKKIKISYADGKKVIKKFERSDGFEYEILHFNNLIREGKTESPIMTHRATVEIMGLLEEINRQLGVVF